MKKTAKKTAPKAATVAKLPPAPIGLRLLLSLIEEGNQDDAIYARAKQIISDRDDWREYTVGYAKPEESTQLVYPGLEDTTDPPSVFRAGVLIGAAVGWILMTDLAGGAR